MRGPKRRLGDSIMYAEERYDAGCEADALLLLTEWKVCRLPSWTAIHKWMARPLVIDGRNIYDLDEMREYGFEYHCIGR